MSVRTNDDRTGTERTAGSQRNADHAVEASDGFDDAAGAINAAQQSVGNSAVVRALNHGRATSGEANATSELAVPDRSFEGVLGAGRPLPTGARSRLESSFGADLGDVRLHTAGFGAAAARAMGVGGFAVGRDVVLRSDRYAPGRRPGRSLLAHEVAHVLQQGEGGSPLEATAAEREAVSAADAASLGNQTPDVGSTPVRVAPQGYTGSHAVTPETLFELLKSWRGHSVQSGAGKVTMDRLSTDVSRSKQGLGRGNTTTALIAISDASGQNLVEYGMGISDGTNHAEVNAMNHLDTNIAGLDLHSQLRGGHMLVVVDQEVCSACRNKLMKFVDHHGMASVSAYTFVREKMVGSGDASPKTSMRGTTQDYAREPGPLRKRFDFSYTSPEYVDDGSGSAGRRPKQGELFADQRTRASTSGSGSGSNRPRQGELFERGTTGRGRRGTTTIAQGLESGGGSTSRTGGMTDIGSRQQSLFDEVRGLSSRSGSTIKSPPVSLHPGVRFVRFISRVSDLLMVYDVLSSWVTNFDYSMAMAAGEPATDPIKQVYDALESDHGKLEQLAADYDEYSRGRRRRECRDPGQRGT